MEKKKFAMTLNLFLLVVAIIMMGTVIPMEVSCTSAGHVVDNIPFYCFPSTFVLIFIGFVIGVIIWFKG